MKLWISGEIQADIAEIYREVRKLVETEVNRLLAEVSLAEKAEEWAFIAIIREEDSPDYEEIAKKSSRGKALEFRLKISHAEFLVATQAGRISLIFKALYRSVDLMGQLSVSAETQNTLRIILFRAEQHGESQGLVS